VTDKAPYVMAKHIFTGGSGVSIGAGLGWIRE
jgi:hypothetical protein